MDSDSESKLITLISQLPRVYENRVSEWESEITSLIIKITSLVRSTDLDSLPKPESKLMSLVTQTISLFNSMDSDSLPKKLSELISLISQRISLDLKYKSLYGSHISSPRMPLSDFNITSLVAETLVIKPDQELISLIRQIFSVVVSMTFRLKKLICLCPQVKVNISGGKFRVIFEEVEYKKDNLWNCFLGNWDMFSSKGEEAAHFHCRSCNGECHKEYEKAPLEIKHPLHQKHSLQLAWNMIIAWESSTETRKCYCCEDDLLEVFYYCSACDFAMNITCVKKAPDLSIYHPKWHEHTLALFPSQTSLPCNVCALTHTTCPFYICPPCDFVVHQRCISLPRVIRISRHPHRISFTPCFVQGDWSCGVCRRKIDNDYGSYSCIKKGCSYAAHSRCATQSNVWDGIDIEGEPEEIEEDEVEPFVRISDGIIRHFSHVKHDLRLDENNGRDYDDSKQCQACITPIYFGNIYSCVQCEFVLHETCAKLSRKLYHPIHPHRLTLAPLGGSNEAMVHKYNCSVCFRFVAAGFSYECSKEECDFQLHVQCATVSEPLVHQSHVHPLFLTSKPGETRVCSICPPAFRTDTNETFNCIVCDGFTLCYRCAAIPQKVRYKHDKHILTLSYGEETSTMTYWCEACERRMNPKKGLYICDDYCCVRLHIKCLIGKDLYMKSGSSFFFKNTYVSVIANNHMSRPICSYCKKRCPQKIVFQSPRAIACCIKCLHRCLS